MTPTLPGPILLTGASGLLGQAMLRALRHRGEAHILAPRRAALDLLDRDQTLAYFAQHRPQTVIHLAAHVQGLGGNLSQPFAALNAITHIDANLFEAVQSYPVHRLFYAGTVASYPHPAPRLPLREQDLWCGLPHHAEFGYAMAKRHALTVLTLLESHLGVRSCYGVLTNLFGTHDRFDIDHGHVVPSLIAKAFDAVQRGDDTLEVWGDGSAQRDFLFADDAASAALLCLQACTSTPVNIASGQTASIAEVAGVIADCFGLSKLRLQSQRPTGIVTRSIDCSRLRELGFAPAVGLHAGLRLTCAWFRANLGVARR